MAAIKIQQFAGERPSVSPRNLGDAAQRSSNLDTRLSEFTPLNQDVQIATGLLNTNPAALYRFGRNADGTIRSDMSSGWISSPVPITYARGMVDDDQTERTYITANDGSQAPIVIDNNSVQKTLGINPPVKPTTAFTAIDEFTAEEEAFAKKDIPLQMFNAVKASIGTAIFGNAPTGTLTSIGPLTLGWVANGTTSIAGNALTGTLPTSAAGEWSFLLPVTTTGGTTTMNYGGAERGWLFFPGLKGTSVFFGAQEYWAIPFALQGLGYTINTVTLAAQLVAIKNPATQAANWLETVSPGKTGFLAASIAAEYAATVPSIKNAIDALNSAQSAVEAAFLVRDGADDGLIAGGVGPVNVKNSLINVAADAQSKLAAAARRILSEFDAINVRIADTLRDQKFYVDGVAPLLPAVTTKTTTTRFYVTTLVSTWGEESSPSLPTELITIDENDTITISSPAFLADGTTAINAAYRTANYIAGWRLYRTNTGSNATDFQLVEDAAATVGTVGATAVNFPDGSFNYFAFPATGVVNYNDKIPSSKLGEVIRTTTWLPPPVTVRGATSYHLQGIVSLANGVMAAFTDNNLYFCEPYVPYAWPLEYSLTTKYRIVGLAAFGQDVIVLTIGSPYLCGGADSASMSMQEIPSTQSCVSARSIVASEMGAIYASPDGLCRATSSGVQILTQAHFTRAAWQALTPSSIYAAFHDGIYYFKFSGTTPDGFSGANVCYALNLATGMLGKVDMVGSCFHVDKLNDTINYSTGTTVVTMHGAGTKRSAVYRSGVTDTGKAVPLAWIQVFSDFSASVQVAWYGDGVLRHTATFTSSVPQRLPAGRYTEHFVEVTSQARVTSVILAGTTDELKAV